MFFYMGVNASKSDEIQIYGLVSIHIIIASSSVRLAASSNTLVRRTLCTTTQDPLLIITKNLHHTSALF
jgi:hypothetical protein